MTPNKSSLPTADNYQEVLQAIKERVRAAQYEALRAVNKELVALYWEIGRMIAEKQAQEGWGNNIVERLAKDLQVEFPGVKGFSSRNVWYMRNLYLAYKDQEKLQPLVAEIGWAHNLVILDRCKRDVEREFYLRATNYHGWSKLDLIDNIKAQAFERWALKQTNFDQTLTPDQRSKAVLSAKDDYDFTFLELEAAHNERTLEAKLVANITRFLAEMGAYFTFVGRQFRVEFHDEEYFIDLLFYHRKLKCLVAIDLKTVAFKPEHAGQMQFYLSALDESARVEGENPSIGIIVCKEKDRLKVEYTLRDVRRPIGVATYNRYARLKDLPAEIAKYLPSEEELIRRLGDTPRLGDDKP